MPKPKNSSKLTEREMDILNILWSAGKPLIASEIANARDFLTINTVQVVLRNLLKKKLIEVSDIVYSGTVLCRSYQPTIEAKNFTLHQFIIDFKKLNNSITTPRLVATLLEHEKNEESVIAELEKMLEERKRYLKKED
jgi:predicted transcriptional regulator